MKKNLQFEVMKGIYKAVKNDPTLANIANVTEDSIVATFETHMNVFVVARMDDYLHMKGTSFAATTRFIPSVQMISQHPLIATDHYYIIAIDDLFLELPKFAQQAFFYHEIGHCINGDVEDVSQMAAIDQCKILAHSGKEAMTREYNADYAAASVCGAGTVIAAFEWVMVHYGCSHRCKKDFRKRIEFLKSLEK